MAEEKKTDWALTREEPNGSGFGLSKSSIWILKVCSRVSANDAEHVGLCFRNRSKLGAFSAHGPMMFLAYDCRDRRNTS